MTTQIHAIDLFCGVGGLTHGLINAGITVTHGVDIDPACEYPYTQNNQAEFHLQDVATLEGAQLSKWFQNAPLTLLAGCAPCQPFSTYSRANRDKRNSTDWQLVEHFGRLIKATQPDFVTMENVPQLANHNVFQAFLANLDGYHVSWNVVELTKIGLPQTRTRLVVLASKHGPVDLPLNDEAPATVHDTIAGLPPIPAGGCDPHDPLHRAPSLSPINLDRIRHSTPGGTWRDWPAHLRLACHKKDTGKTFPSVYGRMTWDAPAPTITTQCYGYGNGRFGHPTQDRAISLREAAMLQSFPRHYQFVPKDQPIRFNQVGRLIGNAVPVQLGHAIGTAFLNTLN